MTSTMRMLEIFRRLDAGQVVTKKGLAEEFQCDEKAIQRTFKDLKEYLAEHPEDNKTLEYSKKYGGHYFQSAEKSGALNDAEILGVCKILLESRAFVKDEMYPIIEKLLDRCVVKEDRRRIHEMINNEKFYYQELQHGQPLLDCIRELNEAVRTHHLVRIHYRKVGMEKAEEVLIQPLGIMFSEFYFYLIARKCESVETPDRFLPVGMRNYRIDRIEEYKILKQQFHSPYNEHFKEGEFRERIQFMFGGALRRISFRYKGNSLEAVQDRFPNAEVFSQPDGTWLVRAKQYGSGYRIWIRAQGTDVDEIQEQIIPENL